MRRVVLLVTLLAGCYRAPSFGRCELPCDTGCPEGYTCSGGFCAAADESCEGPEVDASLPDTPGDDCDWATSTLDACALGALDTTVDWRITEPFAVDTDSPMSLGGGVATEHVGEYTVVQVRDLVISAGGSLEISGQRPLIVLANRDVSLGGPVRFEAAIQSAAGCDAAPGLYDAGTRIGTGGAGGALGGLGGEGGGRGLATSPPDHDRSYPLTLRTGCPGGPGGAPTQAMAPGGGGGGGLQLSVRGTLDIGTTIAANGGGGARGAAVDDHGGAGGGSGGMIILEAGRYTIRGNAQLCATGGGGGSVDAVGTAGTCMAGGFGGVSPGVSGGDGGDYEGNGMPGASSTSTHGGGGGGGSAGLIFVVGATNLPYAIPAVEAL